MSARARNGFAPEALRNALHLAALSALAFAQPVFDILGRNPTFFAARGSGSTEIVLFALALALLPALVLTGAEALVALASRAAARALHVAFVGALAALLALSFLTQTETLSGAAALAAASAAGVALAFGYVRTRFVPSLLGVLAPAPLVFLALFLFGSDVRKLVFAAEPEVRAATVEARTPVVLIVFDEVTTTSLMDAERRVDRARYPNFARLADDATWYRNASTTFWLSEGAVPAILTGSPPEPDDLPVLADHPRNLFTLLGGSYRLRVVETLTSLCPRAQCGDTRPDEEQTSAGDAATLASDVGIVYLHVVLPEPYVEDVPPIDTAWGNFGRTQADGQPEVIRDASGAIEPCARGICEFARLVSRDRRPTLYFLHSLFPHVPYVFLPSSRRYAIDARVIRGMRNGLWQSEWPTVQAQQRYLLQLVHTDRALGHVLRRLRETGVYDRALVIVTADHGVGFRPRDQRRLPTATNLDEIALVPLFVKLPGQTRGRIDDGFVQTTSVLPTVARVLGVPLRWQVQGRALVGRAPRTGTVRVLRQRGASVEAPLERVEQLRDETLARQLRHFGSGSVDRLYAIGPRLDLVGRAARGLVTGAAAGATVQIDSASLYDAVDPTSGFLPSLVEGRVVGLPVGRELAIAVNGRVAATTETFEHNGEIRFAAFVRERDLRAGRNTVEVLAIVGDGLHTLRGTAVRLTLQGPTVRSASGRGAKVRRGALTGRVTAVRRGTGWEFSGTAALAGTDRRVDTIAVFVGGRSVFVGRAENLRPHEILGERGLGKTGFAFELPPALLPEPGDADVRVFALRDGIASELRYGEAWPWR